MSKSNIYEPVYIQFSSLLNQGVHNTCLHSILEFHNLKKFLRLLSPQKTDFLTLSKSLKVG